MITAPEVDLESPAKIITFLEGTSTEIITV
jgi:hypothetical protein